VRHRRRPVEDLDLRPGRPPFRALRCHADVAAAPGRPDGGHRAELDVIAAVVIGGGSLSGGVGTILGSMIGATIMAVLRNGSQQMGWPNYIQEIIIGAIIVVAVAVDGWRSRRA
jgi:ribose transport system permease protein